MAYSLRDVIRKHTAQLFAGTPLVDSPRRDTNSYPRYRITDDSDRMFVEWKGMGDDYWSSFSEIIFHPLTSRHDSIGNLNATIHRVYLGEGEDHLDQIYRLTILYFAKGDCENVEDKGREGVIVAKSFRSLLEAMEFAKSWLTYDDILMYFDSYI